jgi:hypothetical protein
VLSLLFIAVCDSILLPAIFVCGISDPPSCPSKCTSPLASDAAIQTLSILLPTLLSGPRADFYMFNLDHRMWSPVSNAKGSVPSIRFSHGFTATLGRLYLFGGRSWIGDVDMFITSILMPCSLFLVHTRDCIKVAYLESPPSERT